MNASINLENKEVQLAFHQQFTHHGHAVYPSFFSDKEMLILRHKLLSFVSQDSVYMCAKDRRYKSDQPQKALLSLENLYLYDLFFEDMLFESKFSKFARILLNDSVQAQTIQYILQPCPMTLAGIPKQDGNQFAISPWEGVTFLLALENMTPENGCFHFVDGSHKLGMRNHDSHPQYPQFSGITDFGTPFDLSQEVCIPLKAGDLLMFHPLTIHRFWSTGDPNQKHLKAIRMVYYANKAIIDEHLIHHLETEYSQRIMSGLKKG